MGKGGVWNAREAGALEKALDDNVSHVFTFLRVSQGGGTPPHSRWFGPYRLVSGWVLGSGPCVRLRVDDLRGRSRARLRQSKTVSLRRWWCPRSRIRAWPCRQPEA